MDPQDFADEFVGEYPAYSGRWYHGPTKEAPMTPSATYPALDRLRAHLDTHEGKIGAAEAPMAIAALREFLESGAKLGRGMRNETAKFRPTDEVGATLAYLFVITVDASTHEGREGALKQYAESDKPLAAEASELYRILTSEAFMQAVGRRPIQGGHRGCQS